MGRVDTPLWRFYSRRVSWIRTIALLPVLLGAGLAAAQALKHQGPAAPAMPALERASEVPDPQKIERSAKALATMRVDPGLRETRAHGSRHEPTYHVDLTGPGRDDRRS